MNMSSDAVTRVSAEIAGSEISFETGRMAKQASGAVVVRQGDTMLLATAVAGLPDDALARRRGQGAAGDPAGGGPPMSALTTIFCFGR